MEKEKLDKFRQTLVAMRERIADDFERAVSSSAEEFGSDVPDINDDATRTINRSVLMEISGKSHETLLQIDEALARIDGGDYGQCMECGEDIPEKRLELLPFAQFCVRCKERLEKESSEGG
ncbi:MAG: TraR/DksA family transcriptional regulator [Nitrospinae bacterium]|nr:TraR/DksA family transcriptional regulator [Nitrospinota bacterium]